jgi:mannitol-1-/sugar-/sorbitol-6-/2-deoxyglucose-6-phosphatase
MPPRMEKAKPVAFGAIFDLDGVLVDSEPLWAQAEIDVFGAWGLGLDEAACAATRGLRIDEVVAYWRALGHLAGCPANDLADQVVARVIDLLREQARPLPGAVEAVERLAGQGVPLGLASSSPTRLIAAVVDAVGLRGAFGALCSAEALPLGKPHPAVYLAACQGLGLEPGRAVAIEDSVVGLVAAKAARMRCLCVPALLDRSDPAFGLADLVLPSLADFGDDEWRALTGPLPPTRPPVPASHWHSRRGSALAP